MDTDGPEVPIFSPEETEIRNAILERMRIERRNERLSLRPEFRITLSAFAALCTGTISGGIRGAKMSGLRFRAENAHRLPKSQKGWYYYHKSKNYQASLAAIREGPKLGAQLAFWVGGFLVLEEALDHLKGGKDFISTVFAALTTSGAYSLWHRFPVATAARTMKTGLRLGLGYGLLQDAMSFAIGRPVGYVEFIKGRLGKSDESTADV